MKMRAAFPFSLSSVARMLPIVLSPAGNRPLSDYQARGWK
jgi:hypothetical protein